MDLAEIRRTIAVSIASDDVLVDRFVLKGGNALELVFGIGARASLDLDYSIEGDLEDVDDVRARLQRALADRFDSAGFVVFDYKFEPRPQVARVPGQRWGGYLAEFKLIPNELFRRLDGDLESIRKQATPSGPAHHRKFTIDISKYEYIKGAIDMTIDEYRCSVYTPAMIAVEKLRALCQQSRHYPQRKHPAPRPRDFYDIHAIVVQTSLDLAAPAQIETLKQMFAIKEVPLWLLGGLEEQREFHRQEWTAVIDAVRGTLREFDFYFDFVLEKVEALKPLWNE